MKTIKKISLMLAAGALSVLMLGGCMDEDEEYTEYETESAQESEASDVSEAGKAEEEASEKPDAYDGSVAGGELTLDNYPLGTVREVEGNIVVVTIVADDARSSWDFDNGDGAAKLAKYHEKLGAAMDWLEKSIA